MKVRTAAAIVLLAGLISGCRASGGAGGSAAPVGGATGSMTPTSTGAPAPSSPGRPRSQISGICGPPDAPGKLVRLRASDGVRLQAVTAGTGKRGVVLVPELGRAGMCGWWEYAAYLSHVGYHVLMFNHRCTGESACPAGLRASSDLMSDISGAVAWLRRAGAVKIALLGGSQGAAESVIAAANPPRGVTGIVALSADELDMPLAASPYPHTALAAAPKVRLPALFAIAVGDPNASVQDTRHLVGRVGSQVRLLVVLPAGSGHGWDLVSLPSPGHARPTFSHTVESFLARVTS